MDLDIDYIEIRKTFKVPIKTRDQIFSKEIAVEGYKWRVLVDTRLIDQQLALQTYFVSLNPDGSKTPLYAQTVIKRKYGKDKFAGSMMATYKNFGEIKGCPDVTLLNMKTGYGEYVTLYVVLKIYTDEESVEGDDAVIIPQCLQQDKFTDFYFIAEDKRINAHKFVLATQSPALNRLMHERYTKTIVNDFSYRTIKGMVDFIYGREVTDFEANAVDLLKAAHKYELTGLAEYCLDYLNQNLSFKHIYQLSFYMNQLREMDVQYIMSHIKAIANNRHFEIYFHQFFNDLYPLLKEKVFELEREIHECFTVTQIDRSKNPENLCYGDVNNDYEKLLENEILSDITFDVNGTRISAHRAILFVRWPHFDQFLNAYYGHGSAAVTPITLKNIDKSAFKAALRYFYCGKLPSSQSDVIELYRVAYALKLEKLKEACEYKLLRAMDETNFTEILDAANKIEFSEYFKGAIFQFVGGNLRLLNSPQWEGLLKSNRAIVVNMISVFLRQF